MAKCIYCGSTGPFDREHSPPRCLGTFKGVEPLRERLCKECNSKLGVLDQHFCRSGPQGFFRHLLGIKGRKRREPYSPFESGADGKPAIQVLAPCPGHDFFILVDLFRKSRTGPTMVEPLRQVVVLDRNGIWHPIFVPDSVRDPQHLRKLISKRMRGLPKEIRCFYDTRSEQWLPDLLKRTYSGKYSEERVPLAKGPTKCRTQLLVKDMFFRGIAKVVFHYYLQHDATVTGDEREFSGIRDFILNGGPIERFVVETTDRPIWSAGRSFKITKYGHLLTAGRDETQVLGWAEFMVGPDIGNVGRYYVKIGSPPGKVVWRQAWGTFFYYYDEGKCGGFDGETEALPP